VARPVRTRPAPRSVVPAASLPAPCAPLAPSAPSGPSGLPGRARLPAMRPHPGRPGRTYPDGRVREGAWACQAAWRLAAGRIRRYPSGHEAAWRRAAVHTRAAAAAGGRPGRAAPGPDLRRPGLAGRYHQRRKTFPAGSRALAAGQAPAGSQTPGDQAPAGTQARRGGASPAGKPAQRGKTPPAGGQTPVPARFRAGKASPAGRQPPAGKQSRRGKQARRGKASRVGKQSQGGKQSQAGKQAAAALPPVRPAAGPGRVRRLASRPRHRRRPRSPDRPERPGSPDRAYPLAYRADRPACRWSLGSAPAACEGARRCRVPADRHRLGYRQPDAVVRPRAGGTTVSAAGGPDRWPPSGTGRRSRLA
jgi:hypothetical protein